MLYLIFLENKLDQGVLAAHGLQIYIKDNGFNLHCILNLNHLFYENLSSKNHGQVFFYRKGYQYTLLFSFTATPPSITKFTHKGEQIYSTLPNLCGLFCKKLCSSFGVSYRQI